MRDVLLVLLSSAAMVLSFPDHDWSLLAWVGLVPLLLVIRNKSCLTGFVLSLVWAMAFLGGVFHWIHRVSGYSWLHHFLLAVCFGLPYALMGCAFSYSVRKRGTVGALTAMPFLWVSVEYLRSNLSFLSLPWALLAHTQYRNLAVIQCASFTGAWGVTFLICLVNAAQAGIVAGILGTGFRQGPGTAKGGSPSGIAALAGVAGLAMLIVLMHGQMKPKTNERSKDIKISLVQANIPQESKWDSAHAGSIMEVYSELTRRAGAERPHVIVWPETATPRSISQDPALFRQVQNLATETGAWILLGSSQQQKFQDKEGKGLYHTNSAFFIDPEFKTPQPQRQDKIRLLPFGEYLPLKDRVNWSWFHVPRLTSYEPGREVTIFDLEGFRFGTTICWENIFPDLVRRFVEKEAQCVVNITNEAWFGATAAPYQFLAMSVFRAVENRIYVARCANTGVSCIIDPWGRIQGRVTDETSRDIFVRGVLTGSVAPRTVCSIYSRFGDWFALMSVLIAGCSFLLAAAMQPTISYPGTRRAFRYFKSRDS